MDDIPYSRTNQNPYRGGASALIARWQQEATERYKHPNAPSEKSSSRLAEAKRRTRTHTKKESFPCPRIDCGNQFYDKKELARHMKIHSSTSEATSSSVMQRILQQDNPFNANRGRLRGDSVVESDSSEEIIFNMGILPRGSYPPIQPANTYEFNKSKILRRSRSVGSTGSCGSNASGNSDPKAITEDLPDFFETSKATDYWRVGAKILRHLKDAQQRGNVPSLAKAMASLSLAATNVNLNAKAWSALGITLSRHSHGLEDFWDSLGVVQHIETYTKILEDILSSWIYTVDPSIRLSYEDLPPHERPRRLSPVDRHELLCLTRHRKMRVMDEDAIHEQMKELEQAFKTMINEHSYSRQPFQRPTSLRNSR